MENGECPFLSRIRHLQPMGVEVRMTRHRCRRWPQLHCIVENVDSQEEKDIPCPGENLYGRSRGGKSFSLMFLLNHHDIDFFKSHPPGLLSPLKYHLLYCTLQWQPCYLLSAALKPVYFMASPACYTHEVYPVWLTVAGLCFLDPMNNLNKFLLREVLKIVP